LNALSFLSYFQNEQFWQKLSFANLVFVKKIKKKTSISWQNKFESFAANENFPKPIGFAFLD
jgi:hypothetical protein